MRRLLCGSSLVALLVACAHPAPPSLLTQSIAPELGAERRGPRSPPDARDRVVAHARSLADGAPLTARGIAFDPDPVGFVRAAFWAAGIELFDAEVCADQAADAMQVLYRSTARRGRLHQASPAAGDLVFWDATPGATALYPAQVALVERVEQDGTVVALGLFADGPTRVRMNLRHPDLASAPDGRRLNDQAAAGRPLPLAHLFRSFADPFSG